MKRREFMTLVREPHRRSPPARSRPTGCRRIGVLMGWSENDPEVRSAERGNHEITDVVVRDETTALTGAAAITCIG